MSSPKVIIDIAIATTRILGKALYAAGQQAVKNAKARPQGGAMSDVAGVGNAKTDSVTDRLTREHRLTLDEAHLILNAKKGDPLERIRKNYEHLFKANSPPPPPEKPVGKAAKHQYYSHYLLSKVYRARERIEAEVKLMAEEEKVASSSRTAPLENQPGPPPPKDPPSS